MEEPTIYTLLSTIRDFSNEVTVRWLASKLGISTSTLMRCKNGMWPRSLKPSVMKSLLDDCRDRFFDGSGKALADFIVSYYRRQGVSEDSVRDLERAHGEGGYDAFIALLLSQALAKRNGQNPSGSPAMLATSLVVAASIQVGPDSAQEATHADPAPADPELPSVEPSPIQGETVAPPAAAASRDDSAMPSPSKEMRYHDLLFALPLAVVLLMGLLGFSLAGLFSWIFRHRGEYMALSLAIALSPALCGIFIDSPLAWCAYKKTYPGAVLSVRAFARVAKYGDPEVMVPGAGRFNLTAIYLFYQPTCNLLSMMCCVALFAFLTALPGFSSFFLEHDWIELFKLAFVAASFLSYGHMREQCRLPRPDPTQNPLQDNPDTFLPTRLHVWANTVHLVWTISLLIIMLMGYLAYSFVYSCTQHMSVIVLWPYLQAMLFFFHTCASPMAPRLRTVSVGMLLPSVAAVSAAFAIPAAVCYLPSCVGAILCVCGVFFTGVALAWTHRHSRQESPAHDWFEAGKSFGAYAAAMTCTVLVLVLVGFLTSAFL